MAEGKGGQNSESNGEQCRRRKRAEGNEPIKQSERTHRSSKGEHEVREASIDRVKEDITQKRMS